MIDSGVTSRSRRIYHSIYIRGRFRFFPRGNTRLRNPSFLSKDGSGRKTLSGETCTRGKTCSSRICLCNLADAVETSNTQNPPRTFPSFRFVSCKRRVVFHFFSQLRRVTRFESVVFSSIRISSWNLLYSRWSSRGFFPSSVSIRLNSIGVFFFSKSSVVWTL